jgi:hypothetical protein
MPEDDDEMTTLRMNFLSFGFEYYVAGRFAVSGGLLPIAGNLFHHAVEMLLKGALCKHLTKEEIWAFGHKLELLWSSFKKHMTSDQSLDSFDTVVAELDKFEDLRYPDKKLMSSGMALTFGFGKATPSVSEGPQPSEPQYQLFVGEIDALVKAILTTSGVNPKFYTMRYRDHGITYLKHENQETSLW